MAIDTMERLRALALEGIAPAPAIPITRARRRVRDDGLAPTLPPGVTGPEREEVPALLREGASLEWRRAARAWTPSIDRLVAQGVLAVAVKSRDVTVTMHNGTQRASGLPAVWIPVVIALLTGRELTLVRAAMRRGVNLFVPEGEP